MANKESDIPEPSESLVDQAKKLVARFKRSRPAKTTVMKEMNTAPINMNIVNMAKKIHFNNPYAASARKLVINELFRNDFIYSKAGHIIQPTKEFRLYMREQLVPFLIDCFDEIMTTGVVPYTFVPDRSSPFAKKRPVVPRTRGIIYATMPDNNIYQYEYGWSPLTISHEKQIMDYARDGIRGIDPNVHFFTGYGFDPIPGQDGVRSPVSACCTTATVVELLNQYAIDAEEARTDPILITQHSKPSGGPFLETTDPASMIVEDAMIQEQSTIKLKRSIDEQKGINTMWKMSNEFWANNKASASKSNPRTSRPIMSLPEGHQIAKTTLPSPRTDIGDLNLFMRRTIFGIYGIPEHLLYSDALKSSRTMPQHDITFIAYQRSMERFRWILSDILNKVYQELFEDSDIASEIIAGGLGGEKEGSIEKIVLDFPNPLNHDKQALKEFYYGNIIPWDDYYKQMALLYDPKNGSEIVGTTKDPLTPEEKKELFIGSVLRTSSSDPKRHKSNIEEESFFINKEI